MTATRTVVVVAKAPIAGRVKTRLCPPFSTGEAADIAAAALHDTLDIVAAAPCQRRVLLLDGDTMPWVPPQFEVLPQPGGGLDVRLAAAFAVSDSPTVIVGMDTPQISCAQLDDAFRALDDGADAVLGPARDGGYWLLGLARPRPDAVLGIPMSRPWTGRAQRTRLDRMGLRTVLGPELRDVDTAADATAVAALAPGSRFASTVERITASRTVVGYPE